MNGDEGAKKMDCHVSKFGDLINILETNLLCNILFHRAFFAMLTTNWVRKRQTVPEMTKIVNFINLIINH